jgi:hypothetical protein
VLIFISAPVTYSKRQFDVRKCQYKGYIICEAMWYLIIIFCPVYDFSRIGSIVKWHAYCVTEWVEFLGDLRLVCHRYLESREG